MNNKRMLNVLGGDRQLLGLFSGVVLSAFALLSVIFVAGVWYL